MKHGKQYGTQEVNRLGEIPLVWTKTRGELRGKSIIKSRRRRVRNHYALCNTGTLKAKQRKHSFTQCIVKLLDSLPQDTEAKNMIVFKMKFKIHIASKHNDPNTPSVSEGPLLDCQNPFQRKDHSVCLFYALSNCCWLLPALLLAPVQPFCS